MLSTKTPERVWGSPVTVSQMLWPKALLLTTQKEKKHKTSLHDVRISTGIKNMSHLYNDVIMALIY